MIKTAAEIISQVLGCCETAIEYLDVANSDLEKGLPTSAAEAIAEVRARLIASLDKIALVPTAIDKEFDHVEIEIKTGADYATTITD